MFCATSEGIQRQVKELTTPRGDAPRLLRSGKDVLEALLALEMGMDVVADARTTSTGWRLPDGVEIGFDADMMEAGMEGLRAQCEARAHRIAPVPGLQRVSPQPGQSPHPMVLIRYDVRDPFGAHEPVQAEPEAA